MQHVLSQSPGFHGGGNSPLLIVSALLLGTSEEPHRSAWPCLKTAASVWPITIRYLALTMLAWVGGMCVLSSVTCMRVTHPQTAGFISLSPLVSISSLIVHPPIPRRETERLAKLWVFGLPLFE